MNVIELGRASMDNLKSGNLIDGVTSTDLRQIVDSRGAVLHMLRCDSPEFTRFGECYFSEVAPAVVKAWKRHKEQSQNIAVPVGRIRIVIYDDRDCSVTRGNLQVIELGRPDAYIRLHIPPGLWYGFSCISNKHALIANCVDIPHAPDESEVQSIEGSVIPYQW